jgi:pyrroloquinoline-quinone synthase
VEAVNVDQLSVSIVGTASATLSGRGARLTSVVRGVSTRGAASSRRPLRHDLGHPGAGADGRRMLAENLTEEEGIEAGKQDHAALWLMFACGLGESEEGVRAQELNAETQALIDTFRKLSRRSYASGLGALYAYESQFPGVATAKIEGLVDRYGIDAEETLRFFRVHQSADVEHSDVCRALLDKLPQGERDEAIAAGEELAGALWNFLSGVEARAPKESAIH